MKLSVIRNTCGIFRGHQTGRVVNGFSRRCLPVGPSSSSLFLRTASATSSGRPSPKLAINLGKTSSKEDAFECDGSLR